MKKLLIILTIGLVSCKKDAPTFIENNYYNTPPVQTNMNDDLILDLPFNGNAGIGNKVYGATLTTDRFNNRNSAYEFNSGFIQCDYNSNLNISSFTINTWIYINGRSNDIMSIVSKDRGLASTGYAMGITPNNLFYGQMNDGKTNYTNGAKITFPTQMWFMVTFSYDFTSRTAKTYHNGRLVSTNKVDVFLNTPNSRLLIGAEFEGSYKRMFIGKIDDVKIYRKQLTDTQVLSLYK